MKKAYTYRIILLISVILVSVMIFSACTDNNRDAEDTTAAAETDAQTTATVDAETTSAPTETTKPADDTTTPAAPSITSAENLTLDGSKLTLSVANTVQSYDFNGRIKVSTGSSWIVANDKEGLDPIPTKTVTLKDGDNVLYVIVSNGSAKSVYTVTITREAPPETTAPVTLPVGQYTPKENGIGDTIGFPAN